MCWVASSRNIWASDGSPRGLWGGGNKCWAPDEMSQDRGLEVETQVCEAIKVGVGTRRCFRWHRKWDKYTTPIISWGSSNKCSRGWWELQFYPHAIINNHSKSFIFKVTHLFSLPLLLFSLHLPSLDNIYPRSLSVPWVWWRIVPLTSWSMITIHFLEIYNTSSRTEVILWPSSGTENIFERCSVHVSI